MSRPPNSNFNRFPGARWWRRETIMKWMEYEVLQDEYTDEYANRYGTEQGYHIPHWSDHESPQKWSMEKQDRLMGREIIADMTESEKRWKRGLRARRSSTNKTFKTVTGVGAEDAHG